MLPPKKTPQRPVWGCGKNLSLWLLGSGGIRSRLRPRINGIQRMRLKHFWTFLAAMTFLPWANAQVSTGTGFALAPGLLVTNHHVIDGCTAIEVVSADVRRRAAVVDADPLIDLELLRVLRGGSWYLDPVFLRSANRSGDTPDYRIDFIGLRLARTLFTP